MISTAHQAVRDAIDALARKHRDTQYPSAVSEQDADAVITWSLARSWMVDELERRPADFVMADVFNDLTDNEARSLFAAAFVDRGHYASHADKIITAVVRRHLAKHFAREANLVDLESEAA